MNNISYSYASIGNELFLMKLESEKHIHRTQR
jgi:hypothetical protein